MTAETLAIADKSPEPSFNGGKSMKFTFQPESKPFEGYTIKRAIHRGGFGEVYYALTDAGKEVALKLLKQHLDVELRGVAQCLNLKHTNLVTIFDVKQDADGDHWVIMEYVAGKSLAQVLDSYPDGMPIDDVQQWLSGIVDGLSFLHDRGIVHRDLKPGNVFIENGVVKIGDVGLSKFISESHRSAQTQSVGTVYYMAPEVAHGRYGREVDVYSLGIMLYELLTGRVPFIGESAGEILMKHLSERPDLSPIPRRLRPVLAQALEKDPLRRTPTARQLLEDFKKAVRGFDVPQEIPEESFIAATIADSSAIDRGPGGAPGGFPQMIPDDVAERMGLDRSARFDLYKAELQKWAANLSKSAQPNLKDIIAADVAKAMEVAEKAARKAKELAKEARRASYGNSKHEERMKRQMEKWAKYARKCQKKYPTVWNSAVGNQDRPNVYEQRSPANVEPRASQRPHRGGRWVKPVLIAIVVLALIPKHMSRAAFEIVTGPALCALLIYGIYKCVVYLFATSAPLSTARAMPMDGLGAARLADAPLVGTPRPPEAVRQNVANPPVSARRFAELTPDSPRLISARHRMSELTLSLTYATLCTALITGGLALFTNTGFFFTDRVQLAQFGGTSLLATWLLLAQAKFWEGSGVDLGLRRVLSVLTGAFVGLVSWWLNRLLLIDVPTADSIGAAFGSVGQHTLIEPGSGGQPSLAGYIVFFACLIGFRQWWKQADSFRSKRLSVWAIVPSALLGFVITAIFAFPTGWGTTWAAAISATLQLSAAWVPQPERAALMEAANHA